MMVALHRPCVAHRTALLDWIDRRANGPGTAAALAHLDRCRACEDELAGVALAIAALRRVGDDLVQAEPPPDAWLRLRTRISRRSDPWAWRASLGGLATSSMLVAVLVMPFTIGRPATGPLAVDLPAALAERRAEAAYLAGIHVGSRPAERRYEPSAPGGGSAWHLYPDEIAKVRKEVPPVRSSGRPPAPI